MPRNNFLAYATKKTKSFGSSMKKFGTGVQKDLEGGMNKMKKKMGMSKRKASPKKRTMRKTASRKSKATKTTKTYTASQLGRKKDLKKMTHKGKKYYVKSAKQTDTNRTAYTRAADKKRNALPPGRRYVYVPELRRYVSYTETRVDRSDKRRGRV